MKYTKEQIAEKLNSFTYWYHKIDLGNGIVTPGMDLEAIWENTRVSRDNISYQDKRVLDIASFDGLFSFEAESLGAKEVVAADCLYRSFNNFLFCREVLGSKCLPYYNISPYDLTQRLDVYLQENYDDEIRNERLFDVVQHLGLLYHLRDPMLSLSQTRSVMKEGGKLLIETDFIMDVDESFMLFNGNPNYCRVRDNYSVWWAPTKECLIEMLESSFFEVDRESISSFYFETPAHEAGKLSSAVTNTIKKDNKTYRIGRIAVVATAIGLGSKNEKFEREMCRTYRNPGLDLEKLNW